jgi:hypothetical protein
MNSTRPRTIVFRRHQSVADRVAFVIIKISYLHGLLKRKLNAQSTDNLRDNSHFTLKHSLQFSFLFAMSAQHHRMSHPELRNAKPEDLSGPEKAIIPQLSPNLFINVFPELCRFDVDSILMRY